MSLDPNALGNRAKIEIRGYPIDGYPWSHIFIVYTVYNSSGDKVEYYFRGGPSADGPSLPGLVPQMTGGSSGHIIGNPMASSGDSPWGKVIGWQGIYEKGTIDYGRPNTTSITIIDSTQSELEPVFSDISDKLHDIVNEEHYYNPLNSNSNTLVFTILKRVGIDFPNLVLTPKLPLGIDGKEIWAPAATTYFTTPLQDMQEWGTVKFKNLIEAVYKSVDSFGSQYQTFKDNLIHDFKDALIKTQDISDSISQAYWDFLDAIVKSLRVDPLIIDFSGDGLKLDSWQASNSLFDLNADGTKENTGWTKANGDDAFLVIDKNNDGKINDITEMFGSATVPGFTDLKNYDSNNDNLINATDTQFGLLRLWNDKNANGVVDVGEITNLAANNIKEISLNKYGTFKDIEGNLQTAVSTVTKTDGTVRNIHELAFAFDATAAFTANPDAQLPATFKLDITTILMPYSRGYGSLNSWQAAMTLDANLLNLGKDLLATPVADFYKINEKFENFLFRWAKVENATNAVYEGVVGNLDPRKIAFMEKITGQNFINGNKSAIALAQKSWDLFFADFLSKFLVQGNLAAAFPHASYDFATDSLKINDTLDAVIANVKALAPQMGVSNFINYAFYVQNILKLNKDQFTDALFDSKVDGLVTSIIGTSNIAGFSFDGRFNIGGSDTDILYGTAKNDVVSGFSGNDELYGFLGNDFMEGGKGNDYLKGDAGNDIYRFMRGDGQDTIDDNAGVDKILLGVGISAADLSFTQVGNDLVMNIGAAGDKIGIKNFYTATANRVETVEFADGSTFSLASLGVILNGDALANNLTGTGNNDIINAGAGNDVINSGYGDDIITGGKGNDVINGGGASLGFPAGNDIYIFNLGDGQDVISDWWGVDQIIFGAGISKNDVQFISDYSNEKSLIIKVGNGGDQIRIQYFFTEIDFTYKIEKFKFADGSVIDWSNGITLSGTKATGETLAGSSANDNIKGNAGNDIINSYYGDDIIEGGKGNDIINGGISYSGFPSGSDTYVFNLGDGQDVITDSHGVDQIVFGAGISKNDVQFISDYSNEKSLIIKVGNGGDQIRIQNFFYDASSSYKIESLKFADGSVLDLANGITLLGTKTGGEILSGTDKNDTLTGNIGNDTISSYSGNDTITGGKGNDVINGSHGNDAYIFNLGDGQDVISDYTGIDQIVFGAGISKANIQLISDYANEKSLIIKVGSGGDQIRIQNFFYDASSSYKIESLKFADGSTFDLANGITLLGTKTTGEMLLGTDKNDTLTGNIGADIINGYDGNDSITGGKGNDVINGYYGNDAYIFNLGDGQDVIADLSGIDQIVFGAGISKANIQLMSDYVNEKSLIIKVGSDGDQIRIQNFFYDASGSYKIESLKFADGSTLDLANGITLLGTKTTGETLVGANSNDTLTGNIGNDIINGYDGNDTITGGKGNDVINGSYGNDTYIFNLGDGQDVIADWLGIDQIIFGAGISKANIQLISDYANEKSLIIKVGSGGDQIRIQNFFYDASSSYKIESLKFADGSTFDLANGITLLGTKTSGETLSGTDKNDTLTGNIGGDIINGYDGNDSITGGKGNDVINGSYGNDAYIFNLGDGQDVISDYTGIDQIIFGAGIIPQDITMEAAGVNLVIIYSAASDQVTVNDFFTSASNRPETLKFSDGRVVDITKAITVLGGVGDDVIIGTPFADNLSGATGNDYIYGSEDIDVINGGAGNDILKGGGGADIYNFDASFGSDTIIESGGAGDKIVFATGILSSAMAMLRVGNDMRIVTQGKADSISLSNFFASDNNRMEYIQFADGSKFNLANAPGTEPVTTVYSVGGYAVVNEDVTTKIKLLNKNDGKTDYNNVTISGAAINGTASIDASGNIIYTSKANYFGTDSFKISYKDAAGASQIKTISLDVTAVNDAPVGLNKTITTNEDTAIEVPALVGTSDVENNVISLSSSSSAAHGATSISGGKLFYTPAKNYFGTDTFTYTITDGKGGFDTKTVSATIAPVNDVPVAGNDSITIIKGGSALMNILANDSDVEDGFFPAANIKIATQPVNGAVVVQSDGKALYTPKADFYGQDSFKYTVTDSAGAVSNIATATININLVNLAPKVITGKAISSPEDQVKSFNVKDYFYDPEGQNFTIISTVSANAAVTFSGDVISYSPKANFNGIDKLAVTLKDALGATSTTNLDVTVTPVNDIPVAGNDSFFVAESTPTKLNVLGNDSDVETTLLAANITGLTAPAHGTASVNAADGTILYTPTAGYNGADSFTYSVKDANGGISNVATATINVARIINGTANADTIAGISGNEVVYALDGNDTISGSSGVDSIDGGAGIDTISYAASTAAINVNLGITTPQSGGFAAGDTLFNIENITGSNFDDMLFGNAIANILNGGLGNDKMSGGAGVDIFKYSTTNDSGKAAGARDIISDFVNGTDKIDLADYAGAFTFKGTGAFTGTAHEVNYAQASGNTIIGIDADGNGVLDFQIELTGLHTMTASDFLL